MNPVKLTLGIAVLSSLVLSGPATRAEQKKEREVLVTTVENLGRPYRIIEGYPAIVHQKIERFAVKADPSERAIVFALEKLRTIGQHHGADAVVGTRIGFSPRGSHDDGEVLAYGTLVRFE